VSRPLKHKLLFTVTNDLTYDQRIDRICSALTEKGYACTLIGRTKHSSKPLNERSYATERIPMYFQKGKLFYLEYNFKLFWKALFKGQDVYCAIDLDTYLPMLMAARIRGKKLVYDAHEYFSELEEVVKRPFVHFVWQKVESIAMQTADAYYTISEGYASLFKKRYNTDFRVIRNVPELKEEIGTPREAGTFIIYQGALNVGRGIEEAIMAMKSIDGLTLKIYGEGPIESEIKTLIEKENLSNKVAVMGAALPEDLKKITTNAFAGLTLFSSTGLHHQFSLANRFFDYFHAGIPQVAMNYPEYKAFNEKYNIAELIDHLDAQSIASAIAFLQENKSRIEEVRANCQKAARENNWQRESHKLIEIFDSL
jgi:glycosyltransferase involved in cell wall biosynthesis